MVSRPLPSLHWFPCAFIASNSRTPDIFNPDPSRCYIKRRIKAKDHNSSWTRRIYCPLRPCISCDRRHELRATTEYHTAAAHLDMTTVEQPARHIHFSSNYSTQSSARPIPVLTTSAPDSDASPDPMDTSSDNAARDSQNASPRGDKQHMQSGISIDQDTQSTLRNGAIGQHAVGAAAAAQQPKAISAAFIHKLYR